MGSIVPEYLRARELVFEIRSRGEIPESNVRDLRSQFRRVVSTTQTWNDTLVVEEELKACRERMEELSGEVASWSSLPTGSAKTSALTQFLHWQRRLKLLCEASDLPEEDKAWAEVRVLELEGIIESIRT